jgi:nicotinamide-nucleotide amidase
MRVELLNIGTELLMGFVLNAHAAYLGRKLNAIGATLVRQTCVNDTPMDIQTALNQAMMRADLVITSGGLGPTSDDITRTLIVEMFGLKTRMDEKALENVSARYRRRGLELSDSIKSQAIVPDTATVLYNDHGTAPGLAIPIQPVVGSVLCKWLIMLPGPPRELCPMFEKDALPLIVREFRQELPILDCRVFKVAGMGESSVEQMVEPTLKSVEGLEIGYCARFGEVDVRLVVRGKDDGFVKKVADECEGKVRKILGNAIFGRSDS